LFDTVINTVTNTALVLGTSSPGTARNANLNELFISVALETGGIMELPKALLDPRRSLIMTPELM